MPVIEVQAKNAPEGLHDAGNRNIWQAIRRGFIGKCPRCGEAAIYERFLKIADQCSACGEELHHHRADDAPPYFTIFIVGHIIVGLVLTVETVYSPPIWVHAALWTPLILVMSLGLLPMIKGALVGLQWSLFMHGFGGEGGKYDDPHIDTDSLARYGRDE